MEREKMNIYNKKRKECLLPQKKVTKREEGIASDRNKVSQKRRVPK